MIWTLNFQYGDYCSNIKPELLPVSRSYSIQTTHPKDLTTSGGVHNVKIVKGSVAGSVPDRASVLNRNTAFEVVSSPEQNCSDALLKVELSVSNRFLNSQCQV